jgi:hypothetical protein
MKLKIDNGQASGDLMYQSSIKFDNKFVLMKIDYN